MKKELKEGLHNMITLKPQTSVFKTTHKVVYLCIICMDQWMDSYKRIQRGWNLVCIVGLQYELNEKTIFPFYYH